MNDLLQQELIKVIMGNFGISPSLGEYGIISQEFLTSKKISVETDDGILEVFVVAAQAKLESLCLKAAFISILEEFILVFQLDNFPIHALRISGKDWEKVSSEESCFYKFTSEDNFQKIGRYDALMLAAGTEKIAGLAVWEKCSEFEGLYKAILKTLET